MKSQPSSLTFQIPGVSFCIVHAALWLPLLAGCSSSQSAQTAQDTFFQSPDEVPLATRLFDTQAARGARADATLYPQHFTGPRLNSLGRSKIDLMLLDTDAAPPLRLFIDGQASDPAWMARADAVKQHLADLGLTAGQVEISAGPNPETWHPVARDIEALSKPPVPASPTDTGFGIPSSSRPPAAK